MPRDVIARMIEIGTASGEISKELPFSYISMEIASSVLTYIIYILNEEGKESCSKLQMHHLICRGLLKTLQ